MLTRPLPSNSVARKYDRKYLAMLGFPLCAHYIRLPGLPPKKNLRSSIRFNENGLLRTCSHMKVQPLYQPITNQVHVHEAGYNEEVTSVSDFPNGNPKLKGTYHSCYIHSF